MKLYVFRHGQTDGNLQHICQTDDYVLNETGIRQAEELKQRLSSVNLPIIYASPFPRALKTAEIVASAHNTPIELLPDLREMSFGEAEGSFEEDMKKKYGKLYDRLIIEVPDEDWDIKFPGGESKREALERFKKALAYVKKNCPYDKAGLASHGHIMRLFYYDKFKTDHVFANCEYFVLDI